MTTHRDPLFGLSAGFLALCLNFLIVVLLSLVMPAVSRDPSQRPGTLAWAADA
jgi:hypothetical protein